MKDNIYILNHKELKRVLKEYNYSIDDLSEKLKNSKGEPYNTDTLLRREGYRIFNDSKGTISVNESTFTINRNLAKALKDIRMERCFLDVNKFLFFKDATGITVFKTNEKILITCMIFGFPEIIEWDETSIYNYAKDEADIKLNKAKIKAALENSDAFTKGKTTGKYKLNIDAIISRIYKEEIIVSDDEAGDQN